MDTTGTIFPYFLYALGILFREGLEALLVIIALLAGTREAGQSHRDRDIYAGALIAIAMSIALAWTVNHFIADNTSDTLEGVFQILAAVTLFYVSSWLTAKTQTERWMSFINAQIDSARRSTGPSIALGLTAFLAVMREGAETIVFFQALLSGATASAEKHAVMAGVAVASFGLLLTFVLLRRASYLIPLGSFFSVTSILLYGLAVIFVGQGVASFQEAGVIGATFVNHVPTIKMLGVFPTVQSLVAQAILLLIAAAAVIVPLVRRPKPPATAQTPCAEASRPEPRAV
jgi:high-affinity iron transporter